MAKAKEPTPMEKAVLLGKELADSYSKWERRYRGEGTIDPFYADGYNLNMIRNQIYIQKKRIEKELPRELYPDEYLLPIPDLMNNEYVALQDEWVEVGEKRILEVKQMPDYLTLIHSGYSKKFNEKQDDKNHIYYYAVVGYVKNFERSLQDAKDYESGKKELALKYNNPYLDLRRYASYKDSWWHEAFSRCITIIQKQYPELLEKSISTEAEKPLFTETEAKPPMVSIILPQRSVASQKTPHKKRERNQIEGQFSLFDFGIN